MGLLSAAGACTSDSDESTIAAGGAQAAGKGGQGITIGDSDNPEEACGNQLDDDLDGLVDEACSCDEGTEQPCWPGAADKRNVGPCKDGLQTCGGTEFPAWGECVGFTPALAEDCKNGIDDDCDGSFDCADSDCPPQSEVCDNGVDDDCDGVIDEDCTVCGNEICEDGETCTDCVEDCGACTGTCGDGLCNVAIGETCTTCTADCGACGTASCQSNYYAYYGVCCPNGVGVLCNTLPTCAKSCNGAVCGDAKCEKENCSSCPADCGACFGCGDKVCMKNSGETCSNCQTDCGKCAVCGDGICKYPENMTTCPQDCSCGDGTCEPTKGESWLSCPADCPSQCGNSVCSNGESCYTCQKDCGNCCPAGTTNCHGVCCPNTSQCGLCNNVWTCGACQ